MWFFGTLEFLVSGALKNPGKPGSTGEIEVYSGLAVPGKWGFCRECIGGKLAGKE